MGFEKKFLSFLQRLQSFWIIYEYKYRHIVIAGRLRAMMGEREGVEGVAYVKGNPRMSCHVIDTDKNKTLASIGWVCL